MNGDDTLESLPATDRIRRLLDELAALIQRIEASAAQGSHGTVRNLITANEATTHQIMDSIGAAINDILMAEPPAEELAQMRGWIATPLVAWSSTSPVFYHVLHTPRDSFDDFEITDLLLENRLAGADIAAQVLDNYYLNMTTSSAFRHRIDQFADHLATETRRRAAEKRPVRILNLHTGAGRELALAAQKASFPRAVHVTCLGTDPVALRRARGRLTQLAGRVNFVLADPREFVPAPTSSNLPYDIIYALNLFDQLSDRQTTKLIADCYHRLAPGGVLLFGNFSLDLPIHERVLIDWLMNWNIRCRSEEGLRQIFARTWPNEDCVRCEPDPLNASLLVIATRSL